MAGGKRPVSRPAEERGLKPSLATTITKASERVIADPLGWERRGSGGVGSVSRAAGKAGWQDAREVMEKRPVSRPSSSLPARDAVSHERDVFT